MLKIVVPYRDRKDHLDRFSEKVIPQFDKMDVGYEIILVEQYSEKLFNLGKLINIGFDILDKQYGFLESDSFVFQPIDCVPRQVSYESPRGGFVLLSRPNEDRFYKGFSIDPFLYKRVNGFHNSCWGYGGEDVEFMKRISLMGVDFIVREMVLEEFDHDQPIDHIKHNNFNLMFSDDIHRTRKIPDSGLGDLDYVILDKTKKNNITCYVCGV